MTVCTVEAEHIDMISAQLLIDQLHGPLALPFLHWTILLSYNISASTAEHLFKFSHLILQYSEDNHATLCL
jgi:hypothetical protein